MVDIGKTLHDNSTLGFCDRALELHESLKPKRDYLGMSQIGEECLRKLWLDMNTPRPRMEARILRLFDMGNLIENRVIRHLKAAGFHVVCEQSEFRGFDGRFRGHCDGIIFGIPESSRSHVLEIKTANDKNFAEFKKNGIANHPIYGPKYSAQMQCYMGYSGIDRGLWIVENKNTSEQIMERINFNRGEFEILKAKAHRIITAQYPPEGISLDTTSWKCRFCDYKANGECLKRWPGEPAF